MTDKMPDPTLFSVDERTGEYAVVIDVEGKIHMKVHAESREAARDTAKGLFLDDEFGLELDIVEYIDVAHVAKTPSMFRVWDDGVKAQVSRLRPGHTPREPDENGF